MKRAAALVAMLALLPVGACYSYREVPVSELRPDATVRVELTSGGASSVASQLGRSPDGPLEGEVVQAGAGELLLGVAGPRSSGDGGDPPLRQRIEIPTSGISGIERRHQDTGKTVGLVAGAAAIGTAVVLWSFSASNGTPGGGGGKGGTSFVVSVPLGLLVPGL